MSFQIDVLIHAANVLYLFAFMVRDILWLRILSVVAAACLIPYFYFRPEPLMTPIYWNLVFTALMCCPDDRSGRDQLMSILRGWAQGSQKVPPRLGRIQHEWLRVADVLHKYYDLSQGCHQERRGGASIGKAITLVAANAKSWGTSESNLWKLWTKYKDVAHLIAAAVFICADVRRKHRRSPFLLHLHDLIPFQIVMLIPDLVIAVAIEFQRFGLENVPYAQTEPTFDPELLWRIPDNINVTPLPPQVRTIRKKEDIPVLNDRRAGNRGRANQI